MGVGVGVGMGMGMVLCVCVCESVLRDTPHPLFAHNLPRGCEVYCESERGHGCGCVKVNRDVNAGNAGKFYSCSEMK